MRVPSNTTAINHIIDNENRSPRESVIYLKLLLFIFFGFQRMSNICEQIRFGRVLNSQSYSCETLAGSSGRDYN